MRAAYLILLIVSILFFLWGIYFFFDAQQQMHDLQHSFEFWSSDEVPFISFPDYRDVHIQWLIPVVVMGLAQLAVSVIRFRFSPKGGMVAVLVLAIIFTLLHLLVSFSLYTNSANSRNLVSVDIIFSELFLLVYIVLNAIGLGIVGRSAKVATKIVPSPPSDVTNIRVE